MSKTFAEITEAQIVELSASDIEMVSGAEVTWGIQDPNDPDSWEWG